MIIILLMSMFFISTHSNSFGAHSVSLPKELAQNWSFIQKWALFVPITCFTQHLERILLKESGDGRLNRTAARYAKFCGASIVGLITYLYGVFKVYERAPRSRTTDALSLLGAFSISFLIIYGMNKAFPPIPDAEEEILKKLRNSPTI